MNCNLFTVFFIIEESYFFSLNNILISFKKKIPNLLRSGDVQGTPSIPLYLYIVPAGAIPPVSLPGLIDRVVPNRCRPSTTRCISVSRDPELLI